jgi:hypothetical protein
MADVDLERPAPRHTTSATDFASVGLWAAAQRAELLQLTKELRSLEAAVPTTHLGDAGEREAAVPGVEGLLETAVHRLLASADAARVEAAALVATAVHEATRLLEGAGADDATVRRVTATRPDVVPAPPDAAALRRAAAARVRASLLEPASAHLAPDLPADAARAAEAYDLFWGDVPADRPVRERLRRFGQRSES